MPPPDAQHNEHHWQEAAIHILIEAIVFTFLSLPSSLQHSHVNVIE
ncbi:hypothetical protein JCM16418A_29680 [Paenibacillus pini]